jgi:heme A synthase
MTSDKTESQIPITTGHIRLLLAASLMTGLLVALGGVVCMTEASKGCPDWPGCYGQIVPPMRTDSILEYAHRVLAVLTAVLIVAAAIAGWRRYRIIRWVSWPPMIAVIFLVIVTVLGALTVLVGLSPGAAALDVGSALMVLALMLTALTAAVARQRQPTMPDRLSFGSSYARLALATLIATFAVLVSGVLVAGGAPIVRCLGWPLASYRLVSPDVPTWLPTARLLIAIATGLLIVAVVAQTWRTQRHRATLLRAATAAGLLFLAELAVGAALPASGFSVFLLVLYVVAATALWATLVILGVLAGLPTDEPRREQPTGNRPSEPAS